MELPPRDVPEHIQNLEALKQNLDRAWSEVTTESNPGRVERVLPFIQEQIQVVERANPRHPDLPRLRGYHSQFMSLLVCETPDDPYGFRASLNSLQNFMDLQDFPEYQNIDTQQALRLANGPVQDEFTIHRLEASTRPQIEHDYQKEFIIFHGSATSDEGLINAGQQSANFSYGILQNGTIIEFFPPELGQGGAGPYAMLNGDPLVNFKGIGIELSLENHPNIAHEVEDPTPAQIRAARQLESWLSVQHSIPARNVTTSAQTVTRNGELIQGRNVHGDTHTWRDRPDLLAALGINRDTLEYQDSCAPDPARVQEKIDLSRTLQIQYPELADGSERSINYWTEIQNNLNS